MNDCVEIGNEWEPEWEVECNLGAELTIESGFALEAETELTGDDSEIHLIVGDLVEESEADNTEYDFGMEFSGKETSFVYVGPLLPEVDATWSTDAWFHSDGWFSSEGW